MLGLGIGAGGLLEVPGEEREPQNVPKTLWDGRDHVTYQGSPEFKHRRALSSHLPPQTGPKLCSWLAVVHPVGEGVKGSDCLLLLLLRGGFSQGHLGGEWKDIRGDNWGLLQTFLSHFPPSGVCLASLKLELGLRSQRPSVSKLLPWPLNEEADPRQASSHSPTCPG